MKLERITTLGDNGVALDTETHLIQPGLLAPKLVCGSVAILEASNIEAQILSREECTHVFQTVLADREKVIIGANIAFDLLVLANDFAKRGIDIIPQIFAAFNDERIFDLQIAEALHAVANGHLNDDPRTGKPLVNPETGKRGRYSLAMCVDLVLGRRDAKANNEWRLRYAELEHIPIADWPEKARIYPVDDARNTLETSLAQCGLLPKTTPEHTWGIAGCIDCGIDRFGEMCVTKRAHRNLHDLAAQVKAAFALHLGAAWGFRVDQTKVDIVERYAVAKRKNGITLFKDMHLIREDGSLNEATLKRHIAKAYGSKEPCPVCQGSGKVPSRAPRTLRCPTCKGKSVPWKWKGILYHPTIESCDTCKQRGRIIDPRHRVSCVGASGQKTCDGTGIDLSDAVPRSDTGCISTSADTLNESGDDFVMDYGAFIKDAKWLKDYVPYLRQGRCLDASGHWQDIPLTLRPNVLLKSGRVSYLDHIGTFPRWPGFIDRKSGEYIPSFRECIVARDGFVLSSEDFRAGELVTGAQSSKWIVGFSDLGTVLLSKDNEGNPVDVHSMLAARVLGMHYEDFAHNRKLKHYSDTRQASKPFMFGKPGGMGDATIVLTQRRQGPDTPHPTGPSLVNDEQGNLVPGYKGLRFCILMGSDGPCGKHKRYDWKDRQIPPTCEECLQCAVLLSKYWRDTYKEYSPGYFDYISNCVERGQLITRAMLERWPHLQPWFQADQRLAPGEIMQHVSGRVRGGMTFCDAANGFFQGLLADITKAAYWRVTQECYDRTLRVPAMLHDNSIRSEYASKESPLFGSRSIGFFHDELLNEHPRSIASDAAKRVSEIMRDVMRHYCPDYAEAAEAEPTLMLAWDKRASKVIHRGEVQVWTPDHNPKTCPDCAPATPTTNVSPAGTSPGSCFA